MSLKQKLTALVGAGASAIALTVIAHFEGVRYEPYEDVGGVLTVCYGHTGKDIIPNKVYSKGECNKLLESDFQRTKRIWLTGMCKKLLIYRCTDLYQLYRPFSINTF